MDRLLGRSMARTLIIENTAECLRCNPENGILVPDFEFSKSGVAANSGSGCPCTTHPMQKESGMVVEDLTLRLVATIIEELCESKGRQAVPRFLPSCTALQRKRIEGDSVLCLCLFWPFMRIFQIYAARCCHCTCVVDCNEKRRESRRLTC